MKATISIRRLLSLSLIGATLLPAVVAGVAGVMALSDAMDGRARSTIEEHSRVAAELVADRQKRHEIVLAAQAPEVDVLEARTANDPTLGEIAKRSALTYVVAIDRSGRVIGSSIPGRYPLSPSGTHVFSARSGSNASGYEILPRAIMAKLGLEKLATLAVKETPGGTSRRGAVEGGLSLVTAVPLRDASGKPAGALVGYEVLNQSGELVDGIVANLGGTATVFQDEIRVSTTVRNDKNERAIGTVASDKIQAAVLAGGKPYVGEALVVGNQYMTSYQPMRDFSGKIIGMLYVGIPLDPYDQARDTFVFRFISAILACVVVVWVIGLYIARQVSQPLQSISDATVAVAGGDLHTSVPHSGIVEIGRVSESFNQMTSSLSAMIQNVQRAVSGLRGMSATVLSASEQQSQTVNRQVAAATETTATLEEMAASFRSVATGADEVRRVAEEALEVAHDGKATLHESIESAHSVHETASATSTAADELKEEAEQIGEVLVIIDSIAEQTKILALNAAIEASRAGEAGKGFGVVATEIRALADSVSQSTARIGEMVRAIQAATVRLGQLAADQSGHSERSVELGDKVSHAFEDILEQLSTTTEAVREIAVAANQQRAASDQVVQAMQQVVTAASESSSAANDIEKAAREVDSLGRELDSDVQGFRL